MDKGTPGVSSFTLKVVAIIGMTMNHTGHIFHNYLPFEAYCVLIAFGGLTFPIMAFLIGEGYRHTSNFKRYAIRLLVFALISQIPYSLFLMHQGNVLFTLLLGLMVLYSYDKLSRPLFILIFIASICLSVYFDWGLMGVPMVLLYWLFKDRRLKATVPLSLTLVMVIPAVSYLLITGTLSTLPDLLYVLIGCGLTIPLVLLYNGKRGRPMKYFFYAYYPLHIAILGIIRGLVFGDWFI